MPSLARLITLTIGLLCIATASHATPEKPRQITDERFGVRVTVPLSMTTAPFPESAVAVLLKSKGERFPSFNIIVQPEPYTAAEISLETAAEKILESYRRIGITDIKALQSTRLAIGGRDALSVHLAYELNGEQLRSAVTVVSGGIEHYILTYIDTAKNFDEKASMRNEIERSVEFLRGEAAHRSQTRRGQMPKMVILLAISCVVFIILGVARCRRTSRGD